MLPCISAEDIGFVGTVTDGPLAGSTIDGVDYLLIRPDGIAVVDARELISGDGPATAVHAVGYIAAPFPIPELAVLADPSFAWPDIDLPVPGSSRMQTAAPALTAANQTVYGWAGTVNVAQGVLDVQARSLASAPAGTAI